MLFRSPLADQQDPSCQERVILSLRKWREIWGKNLVLQIRSWRGVGFPGLVPTTQFYQVGYLQSIIIVKDACFTNTVEHDFNGHEVNGIHGVYGKKCYCRAFHLVNKLHDFNGMHDLSGNFCYDDFFRKTHARLY